MSKKTKLATASAVISAVSVAAGLYRDAKGKYDDATLYTARVDENAYIYRPLMKWINTEISGRRVKFLSLYDSVERLYDGNSKTRIVIKGHEFWIHMERPTLEDKGSTFDFEDDIMVKNLVFTTRQKGGIDALHEFLSELTDERKSATRDIYLWTANTHGSWDCKDFRFRNLDSVFLPEGVKEDIINDMTTFLHNESRYETIGIPWHRGYLFYGEPGNGKSSIASALAHQFKFNLYNLPLSSVKDDKHLVDLISRIQERSVLLLEDIDIFGSSVKRDNGDKGPTLAGLLNALDGVSTPHGLISIITTNREETLDRALVRPGRVDFRLELSSPVRYQIDTMFEHVYGEVLGVEPREFASMADLANVFKLNTTDPESARLAIKKE